MPVFTIDRDCGVESEDGVDEAVAVVGTECYRLYALEQAAVKVDSDLKAGIVCAARVFNPEVKILYAFDSINGIDGLPTHASQRDGDIVNDIYRWITEHPSHPYGHYHRANAHPTTDPPYTINQKVNGNQEYGGDTPTTEVGHGAPVSHPVCRCQFG